MIPNSSWVLGKIILSTYASTILTDFHGVHWASCSPSILHTNMPSSTIYLPVTSSHTLLDHLYLASPPSALPYYLLASTGLPLSFYFLTLPVSSETHGLKIDRVDPAGLPLVSPEISWHVELLTSIYILNPTVTNSSTSIGLMVSPTGETSPYSRDVASHTLKPTCHQVQSPMVHFYLPQWTIPSVLPSSLPSRKLYLWWVQRYIVAPDSPQP